MPLPHDPIRHPGQEVFWFFFNPNTDVFRCHSRGQCPSELSLLNKSQCFSDLCLNGDRLLREALTVSAKRTGWDKGVGGGLSPLQQALDVLINLQIFDTVIKIYFFSLCTYLFIYIFFCVCYSVFLDFHPSFIKGHLEQFQRLTQEGSTLSLRLFSNPKFRRSICSLACLAGDS